MTGKEGSKYAGETAGNGGKRREESEGGKKEGKDGYKKGKL